MDKATLRNVLEGLKNNQSISVRMRDRTTPEDYTVLGVKKGRGKHGSLTATVQRKDGTVITFGTPKNLDILNITVDGEFFGVNSERAEPPVYKTNDAQATILKTAFKKLIGESGKKIRVESTVPEYTGIFTVVNAKHEKGKYGQLHLWLVPEGQPQTEENTVELWSYRHSGIIQNFEILP